MLDELEMRSLFTGEFDERDAVCQIKSGEGGTDAQDWAEMLMRMYNRWADKRGFDIEILAVSEGTEAGLSNVEFVLKGRHAYGLMQAEHGVHRLVRISPFNNEGKRQTAFSAVQVAPFFEEVSEEIESTRRTFVSIPTARPGRRSARQRHGFGRPHHAPAHRSRHRLPERAESAPEQGSSHEDDGGKAPRP